MKNAPDEELAERDCIHLTNHICEKGLRYDLTVPFARYVVQHRNEIQFPFKRYQIQPVWRADRPQKGRYREFYQCDADVVGSDSLINEIELLTMIDEVFKRFGVNVTIKINNRKILAGIAETIGVPDKIVDITVAIDKIDKIGLDNVNEELREKGINDSAIEALQPLLQLSGNNNEKINALSAMLSSSEIGMKGIEEINFVLSNTDNLELKAKVELDISLARGLNYYTGTIIEVKAQDVEIGSITGGGRYDNLTGIFGLPGVSGVGISFGADRIYDVLNTLNLYPDSTHSGSKIIFINFGQNECRECIKHINKLRKAGIAAEIYPEMAKMKKQLAYADTAKIPYVALVGETEMANNCITLKNMIEGSQESLTIEQVIEKLKS